MRDPETVVKTMEVWLKDRGIAATIRSRSLEQKAWDSAVFACSEYIRRLTDYDERLAGDLHLLLTPITQAATKDTPHDAEVMEPVEPT